MSKKLFWLLFLICLLSFGGQAVIFPLLPPLVPIHWNLAGKIDSWGGKTTTLLLAALPLVLLLVLRLLPLLDPRKENYQKRSKVYGIFTASLVALILFISWVSTLSSLKVPIPVGGVVSALVGLLLVVWGNYMPQLRPSFFLGFRTPWALSDDVVWQKTNRAGGAVFVASGIMMMPGALVSNTPWALVPLILYVLGLAGVTIYSYLVYRKIHKTSK